MKKILQIIQKRFRHSGMIARIYAAVLLAAFLPFVVIFIMLWRYCIGVFSDSIHQSATESFRSRQNQIQFFADELMEIENQLEQDEVMKGLLHRRGNPSFLSYQINQRLRMLFPMQVTELEGIYILTGDSQEFLVLFDQENTHLSLRDSGAAKYEPLHQAADKCALEGKTGTVFFSLRGMECVAVGIPEKETSAGRPAVLLFLLNRYDLEQMAQQASDNEELPWAFRISEEEEGRMIAQDTSFDDLLEGGELLEGRIDSISWILCCAVNTSQIRANAMKRFGSMFFAVMAAYILLVVLITVMVNRQIHSLMVLRERMAGIGEDGEYREIDLPDDRDVAFLFSGYNEMVQKVKRQENIILAQNRRNLEIANKQREAELKALELEINPHYLYNTLNTINSVAIEHGDYQVSRLLKGYSSTLVYMLRDRFEPVTIRQEVDWLREYLLLQQERFPGVFTCEIDAEPELMDKLIYKMLLQPFVENVIIHGFEEQTEGGFLSILFYGDEGKIVISIWDNGRGISPDELERIRQIAADPMEAEADRIGILNSCRRMYGYYGDDYSLQIDADMGKGTRVEIRLPYLERNDTDEDRDHRG